jgi:hypothetical protein
MAATSSEANAEAVFVRDVGQLSALDLRAPHVVVRTYTRDAVVTDAGPLDPALVTGNHEETFALTDVAVRLATGDHSGWLGLRASGPGSLLAEASSGARFEEREPEVIGNDETAPTDAPQRPTFSQPVVGAHVSILDTSAFRYTGRGELKFSGPDVILAAKENTTELRTGTTREAGPVARMRLAWVSIEFDVGTLRAVGLRDAVAAAPSVDVRWDGEATFTAREGALHTEGADLRADGSSASIDGRLAAALAPGERGTLLATIDGDLRSTTLHPAAITRLSPAASGKLLGLVALAAVLGGAATWAWMRHRRPRFSVEECVQLANAAAEEGDAQLALDWIARARRLAPGSGRLFLEEGYYLAQTDDVDGALDRLGRAAELLDTGEPELQAARLHATRRNDAARASALVVRALQRSPILILELEQDDALAALAADPAVKRAIGEAQRRLER